MDRNTIDAIEVAKDAPPVRVHVQRDVPPWRIRSIRKGLIDDSDIAAMSGLYILATTSMLLLVFGLSVIWRGDPSETAAGFWPPAGVALVAMLAIPARRWGWVVAAIVVPTIVGLALGMIPLAPAVWWATANIVEPVIGATILHRVRASAAVNRARLMVAFLLGAVFVAPMLAGAIGSIGTVRDYGRPFFEVWSEWIISDGLGVLVVVPLLMAYTSRGAVRRSGGELFALCAVVTVATALAFVDIGATSASLLPYLMLVALIWAGMRFGTQAAAVAGFVVGIGSNLAVARGFGPFADGNGASSTVTLEIFLAIALVTSFVVATMASDLADRDEVQRLLIGQATHDSLTGIPNRVLFAERLHRAMRTREQSGRPVALLLIDLDDFKKINDRYGHPAGDTTLGVVAARLLTSVRPGDLLARLGGDEFVVLCDGIDDADHARRIADDVLRTLDEPIEVGGRLHSLSASIGIAIARVDDPVAATDLLHRADIALYFSKRTDRLKVALFDDELETHTRRRVEIEEELRDAVGRNEMDVHFQPVISLPTGRIIGFEALARWTNRRFGAVGPDEFIPVAEDSGLISELGGWTLSVACRQLAAWRESVADHPDRPPLHVAVNVSARQLSDADFPERVRDALRESGLDPGGLTLEITETAVMDDLELSAVVLAELRQIGVKLSMDDFGTGYSSMTHLRVIQIDTLKIDRSFVGGLGHSREDSAIVRSIVNLGHSFGVEVVAEGVESELQLQQLIGMGCDQGQGFLWSPAIDATTATAMLQHECVQVPERGVSAGQPAAAVASRAGRMMPITYGIDSGDGVLSAVTVATSRSATAPDWTAGSRA